MPSDDELRKQIRTEINAYTDRELMQEAWEAFEAFEAGEKVLKSVEADLRAIDEELQDRVVLSMESRGRLRKFLMTKRFGERRRKRKR